MLMKFLLAIPLLLLPVVADAADITGVPKIREGDQIAIGNSRIRLGGIDAPSVDQLCLNTNGERWTCGVAARDELIKHVGNKSWTCHTNQASVIPARVLFDWDFRLFKVSDRSKEFIDSIWREPVFDISVVNSRLYDKVRPLLEMRVSVIVSFFFLFPS